MNPAQELKKKIVQSIQRPQVLKLIHDVLSASLHEKSVANPTPRECFDLVMKMTEQEQNEHLELVDAICSVRFPFPFFLFLTKNKKRL